jgi:hypothetical protein
MMMMRNCLHALKTPSLGAVKALAAAGVAMGFMAPAHALQWVALGGAGTGFADTSLPGEVFIDAAFSGLSTAQFVFNPDVSDSDLLSFSGIARAVNGFNFPALSVSVQGGALFTPSAGDIRIINGPGPIAPSSVNATAFTVQFAPTTSEVYLGDALLDPLAPATNWTISLIGVNPGDVFSIQISAVPELSSLASLGLGLGLVTMLARRASRSGAVAA